MSRLKITMLAVALFLACGLAAITHGFAESPGEVPPDAPPAAVRLLVLPFQNMAHLHGIKNTLRGPLTRKVFTTSAVAPRSEMIMDAVLMDQLSKHNSIKVQALQTSAGVPSKKDLQGVELIQALQSLGQKNRSDAIMVGYLYGYRDRVGGAFGAEISAHVAFELVLVGVKNGAIMWRRGISETQQPLNENLLDIGKFIRRKGRWVTAREMSQQAMQEMLQSFPFFQPTINNKETGVGAHPQ